MRAAEPVQHRDHAAGDDQAPAAVGRPARGNGRLPHVPAPHAVGPDRGGRPVDRRSRDAPGAAHGPRGVPDRAALRRMLADLTAVGVDDLLVVAGGVAQVGEFHESAQILDSGCLEEAGIRRIGVAGHPEGHPEIGADDLARALATKNRIALERGLDLRTVTQFCFAAAPIVAWERRIREAGNRLPIHVGLPGLTSPTRLLASVCRAGWGRP